VLNGNWIVRAAHLRSFAEDNSEQDVANLLNAVFGKDYFRKYKGMKDLENNEDDLAAWDKLKGIFHLFYIIIRTNILYIFRIDGKSSSGKKRNQYRILEKSDPSKVSNKVVQCQRL